MKHRKLLSVLLALVMMLQLVPGAAFASGNGAADGTPAYAGVQEDDPTAPVDGEAGTDPAAPTDGETGTDPAAPTDGETGTDPAAPADGETGTDPAGPTDGETGTDPTAPADEGAAYGLRALDAPLTETSGHLTISGDTSYIDNDKYKLSDVSSKRITVTYQNAAGAADGTVVVIECFEYGATFANWPDKVYALDGTTLVATVQSIDDHRLALVLERNVKNFTIDLFMAAKALTDEQAEDIIGNGVPTTRIAAAEYVSIDSIDTADPTEEAVLCSAEPDFSDATITQTHAYDYAVSALAPITDSMLRHHGDSQYYISYNFIDPNHDTVIMGWQLPDVYHGGALMEITGVKLYSPSDKLELAAVLGPLIGTLEQLANRHSADVECWWGGWTIGAEQRDSDGAFYLLTPPEGAAAGYDETKQDGGLTCAFYPIWRLKDRSDPLPVDSDAADGLAYTELAAANTVITYKLPGGETGDAAFAGAKLYTFPQQNRDVGIAYPDTRNKFITEDRSPGREVVAGLSYNGTRSGTNEYVNVYNSLYVAIQNGVRVDYLPAYTRPVTQTFVFPYEIQPTKLTLTNVYQNVLPGGTESEIESITYWTADGAEHSVTVNHSNPGVSYIVDPYIAEPDRWCEKAYASEDGMGEYSLIEGVSADNPITRVEIKWKHLANDRRFENAYLYGDFAPERVYFDYNVAEQQEDGTPIPEDGKDVRVIFTQTYDGTYAGGTQTPNDKYLWFKVVPPKTPLLVGMNLNRFLVRDQNRRRTAAYIGGTDEEVMGNVGFWIGTETDGQSEYLESITNPVITLQTQVAKFGNDPSLTEVTDEECLAMLTGAFTAMPRLKGWTFVYTTKNYGETEKTYLIKDDIPEEGRAEQIPLAEGDCFTSIKLEYNGDFNTAHEEGKEAERVFWLMTDVKLKPFAVNPFTGKTVQTSEDFSLGGVRLGGTVQYDGKAALNMRSVTGNYQDLSTASHAALNAGDIYLPTAFLWSTRKAEVLLNGRLLGNTDSTVPGSTVTLTWDLDMPAAGKGADRRVNSIWNGSDYGDGLLFDYLSNSTLYAAPWEAIREAVYVELTDKAFEPDWANTEFFGYPADEYPVEHEIVETNGKRFLKLQFAEGFVRGKWMALNGTTYTDNASNKNLNYNNNHPDKDYPTNGWMTIEGSTFFSASALAASAVVNTDTRNAGGWLKLGLKAKNSAAPGAHHPVGDLYVDVSELLAKYHASINEADEDKSGWDYDRTCYVFTGAVEDEYGLSPTSVTGDKLFKIDGRNADGSSKYTVTVTGAGGDLVNGGTLKITKTATGAQVPAGTSFRITGTPTTQGVTFETVTVSYADFENGVYTLAVPFGTYTVTEDTDSAAVAGYTLTVSGNGEEQQIDEGETVEFAIKNTYVELVTISGAKTWADDNNRDGSRPASITINLMNGDATVASKTVTADDNWAWSFTVPKNENGQEINYTIEEEPVAGYTPEVSGFDVTNTRDLGTLKIVKTATGAQVPAGTTFTISGTPIAGEFETVTVTYEDFTNGVYTLENVPTGKYTVTEDVEGAAVDGYTLTVSGNGAEQQIDKGETVNFAIENAYELDRGTLRITKTVTGTTMPGDVAFTISGTPVAADVTFETRTVRYADFENGVYTLENVPTGDYTVTEAVDGAAVAGYTLTVSGNGETMTLGKNETVDFAIENAYELDLGTLKIVKNAEGAQVPAGTRFTITGTPVAKDVTFETRTVRYADFENGVYTLENVPTGTYTVTENTDDAALVGYKLTVTGDNGATKTLEKDGTVKFTILNKYERTPNIPDNPTPPPTPELNTKDHYAYIIGYPDGEVKPNGTITRAETVTIFFRMLTDESRDAIWSTENTFTDVQLTEWFNNAISTMENGGIINGYPDGSFHPNGNITRAEFAAMAIRFFQDAKVGPSKFSDTIGHWAEEAIRKAQNEGLITGYPDGTFHPDQPITRAEAMTIVNRVLKRAPHKDHLLADMIQWPDNMNKAIWYYADVQEATNSHTYTMSGTTDAAHEIWQKLLPVRDWAAFEKAWSTAHSASNPGEVVNN